MKVAKVLSIIVLCVMLAAVTMGVDSCGSSQPSEADKAQQAKTARLMSEAERQVGMPTVKNFQQRKLMKAVYELADRESLVCYVYIKSDYQGKLMYIGKSLGFGVPFSAQFTNPEYIAQRSNTYGSVTLPQPDPNGLFMPTSSSATWLLMLDQKNEPHPVYLEPEIVVSPFPLHEMDTIEVLQ